MKTITAAALLTLSIGIIGAADLETTAFLDPLLSLKAPSAPIVLDNAVLFTASSAFNRVGIAFAHEGYANIYWFKQLLVSQDPSMVTEAERKKNLTVTTDSGILFHVQDLPAGMENLDYRLIIGGLWTADPLNPQTVVDSVGLTYSRVSIPSKPRAGSTLDAPAGSLRFSFSAPSGEIVTVAGSFNNWDPFMYELRETSPGAYSLTLSLPPGTYQYVFFYQGERYLDPNNTEKVYTRTGTVVSQATVPR